MTDITILTVTKGEDYSVRFIKMLIKSARYLRAEFLLAVDNPQPKEFFKRLSILSLDPRYKDNIRAISCNTGGAIEHVLSDISSQAAGEWILRIDDDESISHAMAVFLARRKWLTDNKSPCYSFPTAWLWGDENHYLLNERMYPDIHTRLVKKELMKDWGRQPHAAAPHGIGLAVDALLLHHKFLVKPYELRKEIAKRYDSLGEGFGTGNIYKRYNVPEEVFTEFYLAEVKDGKGFKTGNGYTVRENNYFSLGRN
jgi:hypothetical protein